MQLDSDEIWAFFSNALKASQVKVPYRKVWFLKTPLKVKVFVWLAFRKSILTKSVFLSRGWKGTNKCMFCSNVETIDHLSLAAL